MEHQIQNPAPTTLQNRSNPDHLLSEIKAFPNLMDVVDLHDSMGILEHCPVAFQKANAQQAGRTPRTQSEAAAGKCLA
jgi:hypothetical protein